MMISTPLNGKGSRVVLLVDVTAVAVTTSVQPFAAVIDGPEEGVCRTPPVRIHKLALVLLEKMTSSPTSLIGCVLSISNVIPPAPLLEINGGVVVTVRIWALVKKAQATKVKSKIFFIANLVLVFLIKWGLNAPKVFSPNTHYQMAKDI
jgi:hypothetical protein